VGFLSAFGTSVGGDAQIVAAGAATAVTCCLGATAMCGEAEGECQRDCGDGKPVGDSPDDVVLGGGRWSGEVEEGFVVARNVAETKEAG